MKVAAQRIRERIEGGGERVWKLEDFGELPFAAVAQALSRLAWAGKIERLSKGVYYRGRKTALGRSRPNPAALRERIGKGKGVYPAGMAAANLLGFSTQVGRSGEVGTSGLSLPRKLMGGDVIVYPRRPEAWKGLSETEAALLDFLRRRGEGSELGIAGTVARLLKLMGEHGRYERLLAVAGSEPPRVRAMLGAIGAALGKSARKLGPLRRSLNPYSRFDFGMISGLADGAAWQMKG